MWPNVPRACPGGKGIRLASLHLEHRRGLWAPQPAEGVTGLLAPQVDEYVDARDTDMGAWFEAQVVRVLQKARAGDGEPCSSTASLTPEDVIYRVKYDE